MNSLSVRFALCLAFALVPVVAAGQTEIPPFTGDVLTVAGVDNNYEVVRAEYEKLNKTSKQKYYAIVIKNSGPGQWGTRDYIDRLYENWQAQAARKGLTLDPDRSVLILLAVENRALAVHAGAVLQNSYGLRGQTIDRELVQPHFIPQVKAGNAARGLVILATEIDKWLAAKDAAKAAEREAAVARAAELKRTAKSSLADAQRLAGEVRKELSARGKPPEALSDSLKVAEEKLAEAAELPDRNPQAALALAQSIHKELAEMQRAVRQMVAQEHDAVAQLEKNEAALAQVESVLDERSRAELAVGPVQSKIDEARAQMAKAREQLDDDPRQALTLADKAADGIKQARDEAAELPKLRGEVTTRAQSAEYEVERVRSLILAESASVGVGSAERDTFEALEARVSDAKGLQSQDYRKAIAAYDSAVEELRALARKIDSARAGRIFKTRTLPLSAAGLLAASGFGVFGWKLRRHLGLKHRAEAELAKFQAAGVELLEKLDALKKRHQMLPFSDRDYSEPMAGATLASYQACETSLAKVRESWLKIMETRSEVEKLVALEKFLKTENLEKALKIMAETPQAVGADEQYARIVGHLDLLENAHEQAVPLLASVDVARDERTAQLESLRAAGLATVPYEPELTACAALTESARGDLRADPIGAKRTLEEAANRDAAVRDRVTSVLARWSEAQAAEQKLQAAGERTRNERSGGLLLAEEAANPDPLLARGQEEHTGAIAALQKGDPQRAAGHIAQAVGAADEAVGRIDAQLAARKFVAEGIPTRRSALASLIAQTALARQARQELAQEFAEASWHNVAADADRAEELAGTCGPRIDRAESLNAEQHYLSAAGLLRQVEEDERQAGALAAGVLARRQELDDLRSRARQEQARLTSEAERVRGYLAAHERIASAEADRALVAAEKLMDGALEQSRAAQPHWPAIAERQQQSMAGLAAAEERGRKDVQVHAELLQRLPGVAQQGQRVNELLRSSTADRARANERYHAAAIALGKIGEEARGAKADWAALAQQLADAAADFEKADAWAREDIRLAQQARDALAEAERGVQRAKSFYRSGISADTSVAEAQLAQARREVAAQDYEHTISLAGSSERAAREAHNDAERAAKAKEDRQDAERRRRLAEQAMAAAAIAAASRPSFGGSSFSSNDSPSSWSSSSSRSPSPSSNSSSSSFSSGSSQSNW